MTEVPGAPEVAQVGGPGGVLEEPLGSLALAGRLRAILCGREFGLDLSGCCGPLSSSLGISFHYFDSFLSGAYAARSCEALRRSHSTTVASS